jgi:HSP20 family protein
MSLVKWEPTHELTRLRDEVDRLFTRTFEGFSPLHSEAWSPSVDMHEENGNIIVKADLPGVKKEDVEITTTDDAITIKGQTKEEKEEKKEGYYRHERRSGSFLRTLPLPVAVDADKAQAVFEDGTVTITLPKGAEAPKGKKVAIQ